ncbi:MAG: hypothetical protein U5N86_03130 [Planctomycetota bacterium]|nr:hypothetical protein [Planctomycetota bacterium]
MAGVLQGKVSGLDQKEARLSLDIGKEHGVEPGMGFHIFAAVEFIELPYGGDRRLVEFHRPIAMFTARTVELKSCSGEYVLTDADYERYLVVGCVARQIVLDQKGNRPPTIEGISPSTGRITRGSVVRIELSAGDPNGDPLVYKWKAVRAAMHFTYTHYPNNLLYVPLDFEGEVLELVISANDRRENGLVTRRFELKIAPENRSLYYKSEFDSKRTFTRYFLGDRFNVDDIGIAEDGTIAILDSQRQRSLILCDPRMNKLVTVDDFGKAIDLFTAGNEFFVLKDTKVEVYNSKGEKVREFYFDDKKVNSYMREPSSVSVTPDGDVCIVDGPNMQVKVFDAQGNYRLTYGKVGTDSGAFLKPVSVCHGKFGNSFVLDSQRKNIQVFDPRYRVLDREIALDSLSNPVDMLYDSVEHDLFVLDSTGEILRIPVDEPDKARHMRLASEVCKKFFRTRSGIYDVASSVEGTSVLERFSQRSGSSFYRDSNFTEIDFLDVDALGNMYLLCPTDRNGLVKVLDRDGWHLASFGSRGKDAGQVRIPKTIRVVPDGSAVFVLDRDKSVVEYRPDGVHVNTYEFDDVVSITVDASGTMYAINEDGDVLKCFRGNKAKMFSIDNRRIARRAELIEVTADGKNVLIANTRGYNFLHYLDGDMSTFPPGDSPFKRFTDIARTVTGEFFVLDDREDKLFGFALEDGRLVMGGRSAFEDGISMGADGFGQLFLHTRDSIRILRFPFLDFE